MDNVGCAGAERAIVYPMTVQYLVAKTVVIMFTLMLANNTKSNGIAVNCIAPYVGENSDEVPDELPRDRPASFEDMAQAVRFFLDSGSEYISGQNVEISGGWLPEKV